jgi:uncharacterized protein (TIGR03790 family)
MRPERSSLLAWARCQIAGIALCLAFLFLQKTGAVAANPSPAEQTAVLFNSSDPASAALAHFYAQQRKIPEDQIVGVPCPQTEEISRETFDGQIADPLRAAFLARGWWLPEDSEHPERGLRSSRIRYLAVIRGIPLRVGETLGYAGDDPTGPQAVRTRNEASVDSELVLLGRWNRSISGAIENPYFGSFTPVADTGATGLLMVGRLDGPTPELVRQRILEALRAEQTGLKGFVWVDARGGAEGPYAEGDRWLDQAARQARRHGFPVVYDRLEPCFPEGFPMRNVAVYFGWYAEHCCGPFKEPCFLPGAVAVHIHSFSALSLRDPHRNWCAPLLAAGAAATAGNVAEPFLALTPNLDIFWQRLRAGYTFAESGWMSERVLSWMTTFIGDPLYRPFPETPEKSVADLWTTYASAAVRWGRDSAGAAAELQAAARKSRSGILWEGLGLLHEHAGEMAAAEAAWEAARAAYSDPADRLRVLAWEWGILCRTAKKGRLDALARAGRSLVRGRSEAVWWEALAGAGGAGAGSVASPPEGTR